MSILTFKLTYWTLAVILTQSPTTESRYRSLFCAPNCNQGCINDQCYHKLYENDMGSSLVCQCLGNYSEPTFWSVLCRVDSTLRSKSYLFSWEYNIQYLSFHSTCKRCIRYALNSH
jgi:hypothetical protein